jgi:hypothetical protein
VAEVLRIYGGEMGGGWMTGKEGQVVEGHEIGKATGRYLTGWLETGKGGSGQENTI